MTIKVTTLDREIIKFASLNEGYEKAAPLLTCPVTIPVLAIGIDLNQEETRVLADLIVWQDIYTVSQLSAAIGEEGKGARRRAVHIALNHLCRQAMRQEGEPRKPLILSWLRRKEKQSLDRTRKNLVRRVYAKSTLFALEEIRLRYPDYDQAQLDADLKRRKPKPKRKKRKPIVDLRRKQLEKLSWRLIYHELSEREYHQTCNRIALLQSAHDKRLPIRLAVRLDGTEEVYAFRWQIREEVVKSFVDLANSPGMTHAVLGKKHEEITSSFYSF